MTVFHVAPHSDRILRGSRLRILLLQFVLTDCMDEPISMKRAHFIWEFTSSANRCSVKQRRVPIRSVCNITALLLMSAKAFVVSAVVAWN